jgi:hypothetical protein
MADMMLEKEGKVLLAFLIFFSMLGLLSTRENSA